MQYELEQIETYLAECYQNDNKLHEAMNYSLLAGGKRFRPLLVLLASKDFGLSEYASLPIAAAVEMIHTYSLIHDDLPALDNDNFRRGKPTNHRQFDEATAILAGDGLLTDAFFQLAKTPVEAEYKVKMIECLAQSAGSFGMIKGQIDDIASERQLPNLKTDEAFQILQNIHLNKTGKLIEASILLPAYAANIAENVELSLKKVSQLIGLWFQIRDDILDVTATTEELGKDAGSDIENDKLTYVALFGLTGAQEKLADCKSEIIEIFESELKMMTNLYRYISDIIKK